MFLGEEFEELDRSQRLPALYLHRAISHHLKLILPELFFSSLIEEWEIADMMDEYKTQDGKVGIYWGDFAVVRAKWGTEALQCRSGSQFCDFIVDLL